MTARTPIPLSRTASPPHRDLSGQRLWEVWHPLSSSAPWALDTMCWMLSSRELPGGKLHIPVAQVSPGRCRGARPPPPHLHRRGEAGPAPGSHGAASAEGGEKSRVGSVRAEHPHPSPERARCAPAGSYLGSGRRPSAESCARAPQGDRAGRQGRWVSDGRDCPVRSPIPSHPIPAGHSPEGSQAHSSAPRRSRVSMRAAALPAELRPLPAPQSHPALPGGAIRGFIRLPPPAPGPRPGPAPAPTPDTAPRRTAGSGPGHRLSLPGLAGRWPRRLHTFTSTFQPSGALGRGSCAAVWAAAAAAPAALSTRSGAPGDEHGPRAARSRPLLLGTQILSVLSTEQWPRWNRCQDLNSGRHQ